MNNEQKAIKILSISKLVVFAAGVCLLFASIGIFGLLGISFLFYSNNLDYKKQSIKEKVAEYYKNYQQDREGWVIIL